MCCCGPTLCTWQPSRGATGPVASFRKANNGLRKPMTRYWIWFNKNWIKYNKRSSYWHPNFSLPRRHPWRPSGRAGESRGASEGLATCAWTLLGKNRKSEFNLTNGWISQKWDIESKIPSVQFSIDPWRSQILILRKYNVDRIFLSSIFGHKQFFSVLNLI